MEFSRYMIFKIPLVNAADGRTGKSFNQKLCTYLRTVSNQDMQLHLRTALNITAYVLTCIEKLQLSQMKAEIGVLVDHSTDEICSQDHEIEHWQSSLASVRKLGDTLFVQNFHSSYLFHLL